MALKILLLVLVVLVVVGMLGSRRRPAKPVRKQPRQADGPDGPQPLPMLSCAHCGVHLPQVEAVVDAEGRGYCSDGHRLAGPG